jgi:hypothetical protein
MGKTQNVEGIDHRRGVLQRSKAAGKAMSAQRSSEQSNEIYLYHTVEATLFPTIGVARQPNSADRNT